MNVKSRKLKRVFLMPKVKGKFSAAEIQRAVEKVMQERREARRLQSRKQKGA